MRERKAVSVNFAEKRVVILVKLRVALCGHTSVSHDYIHAVRNVNLHFPSGKGTLVDPKTVVKVIGNAGRIRAANLTFASQCIQNFVFRMGTQALLKID